MPQDVLGPAARVTVSPDELRGAAGKLADLADEMRTRLAASDLALEAAKAQWRSLRSAGAFESFAEREAQRGRARVSSFVRAGEDVAFAAAHYERTDGQSAASLLGVA